MVTCFFTYATWKVNFLQWKVNFLQTLLLTTERIWIYHYLIIWNWSVAIIKGSTWSHLLHWRDYFIHVLKPTLALTYLLAFLPMRIIHAVIVTGCQNLINSAIFSYPFASSLQKNFFPSSNSSVIGDTQELFSTDILMLLQSRPSFEKYMKWNNNLPGDKVSFFTPEPILLN